jgi:hypothetical protein
VVVVHLRLPSKPSSLAPAQAAGPAATVAGDD